jgi:cytochrome c peroxidase
MFECTRRWLSKLALAARVLAGILFLLLALPARTQDPFILSLAAAIDQSSMTPREQLGLRLFFDSNLSEPAGTACASCHDPRRGFTGNNNTLIGVAQGSRSDQFGTRDAPTLMYLATAPRFGSIDRDGKRVPAGGHFWDGRADTLEEQAKQPLFNPVEMNNADVPALIAKIAKAAYADAFRKLWGETIFNNPDAALDAVAASIAAFERTRVFQPFTSKFDHVMRGQAKFTAQEQRGLSLFIQPQKGNCAHCHSVDVASRDPQKSLFTDFSFRALGLPRSTRIPKNSDAALFDLGLCERVPVAVFKLPVTTAKPPVTDPATCGFFKTPTLRNITITAPYMHNGFFDNLRDAVAFYATRDTDPARWFPESKKFDDLPARYHANVDVDTPPYQRRPQQRPQLTNGEIDDIVEFLYTLTDGYQPEWNRSGSKPQAEITPPRSPTPSPSQPASAPAPRGEY